MLSFSLSNSSKNNIPLSAFLTFPLDKSTNWCNKSSIDVPTIPCGTKLEALYSAKGIFKYSAAALNVSVFPVPVGPTIKIDLILSPGAAVLL